MKPEQKTVPRYVAICNDCTDCQLGPARDSFYAATDDAISHQHETIPNAAQPDQQSTSHARTHSVQIIITQDPEAESEASDSVLSGDGVRVDDDDVVEFLKEDDDDE